MHPPSVAVRSSTQLGDPIHRELLVDEGQRILDNDHKQRDTTEHHAHTHTVETDLVATGQVPQKTWRVLGFEMCSKSVIWFWFIVRFIRFFEQTESHEGGRDDRDDVDQRPGRPHTNARNGRHGIIYVHIRKKENEKRKKGKRYRICPFRLAVVSDLGFDRIGS